MKKYIYSLLNNLMIGTVFVMSTVVCTYKMWLGCICYIISYILLDLHSYIDKKLNYPNNAFINKNE